MRNSSTTPNIEDYNRFYNILGTFLSIIKSEKPTIGNKIEFIVALIVSPKA